MADSNRLSELPLGGRAKICALTSQGEMRRRLQDLGFVKGAIAECVGISPLMDPKAYFIKGAVIALRKIDAASILVKMQSGGDGNA